LPIRPPASVTSSEPRPRPSSTGRFQKSRRYSRRHIGQIQRGGAGAAQAGGALHHVAHHGQVVLEVVARAEGEARGDQAFLELGALAHADAALVQESAAALGGGEQVVALGSYTTACSILPLTASAMLTQYTGKPWMKLVVPSSGSMIQTKSESLAPCSLPDSSARMPWPG
jgi:hypothetical protein